MSKTANTSSARKLPRGQESIAFRICGSPLPNECGTQQHKVPIPRAATKRLMSFDHFINVLRVCLTFGSLSAMPGGTSAQILPERGRAWQYSINWRRARTRSSARLWGCVGPVLSLGVGTGAHKPRASNGLPIGVAWLNVRPDGRLNKGRPHVSVCDEQRRNTSARLLGLVWGDAVDANLVRNPCAPGRRTAHAG